MRSRLRENALCVLLAGAGCATMAWLGLFGFAWNDYELEAKPAFDALTHGHVLEFLRLAPAYGGSLVERTPFALLPGLWGGGALAVYRIVALPCLLAAAALGVWLVARMRSTARHSTLARAVVLGLCVANPLTLQALEVGHPEELLGGVLCVAAVLLAGRDRPVWAGVLLGLAIANKEWALLAAGPVLLALPRPFARPNDPSEPRVRAGRRQIACLTSAGTVSAMLLAPLALVASGGFAAGTRAVAVAQSALFQPWQVWWFLGASNHVPAPTGIVRSIPLGAALSTHPEWRLAPSWLTGVTHPLIVVVGLALAGALWLQRRRRTGSGAVGERDALLALALIMLARCVLDTWDTEYYMLPFVLALLAWETLGKSRRPPVLALSSTVLVWVSFQWLAARVSPDAQSAFFLAWTLPLGVALAFRLYAPELTERLIAALARTSTHGARRARRRRARATDPPRGAAGVGAAGVAPTQEMTVSSLGSPVSTS